MNTDEFVDNVLANLKVIGMLQKSNKLCIRKGQLAIDTDDHLQSVRRWYNKDSRDMVLMNIRNIINNAIKISEQNHDGDLKQWTLTRMNEEMRACEMGLQNLKTTYMGDAMMIASLDVLIDRLQANYARISRTLISNKEPQKDTKDKETKDLKEKDKVSK